MSKPPLLWNSWLARCAWPERSYSLDIHSEGDVPALWIISKCSRAEGATDTSSELASPCDMHGDADSSRSVSVYLHCVALTDLWTVRGYGKIGNTFSKYVMSQ